jgi:hypothetical protein
MALRHKDSYRRECQVERIAYVIGTPANINNLTQGHALVLWKEPVVCDDADYQGGDEMAGGD